MIELKRIREFPSTYDESLKRRGQDPISAEIIALDHKHRAILTELQSKQTERNLLSKEIGTLKQKGSDASALMSQVESIKNDMTILENESAIYEAELHDLLMNIPNWVSDLTPHGTSEDDNQCVRVVGHPQSFDFTPKSHDELGESLGLMDFERATKVSGSRFVALYGSLARMERALAQFMLDNHTREFGYTEVHPPILVQESAMYGTDKLPKFKADSFHTNTGLWLIPTSEVSLTYLVADEILSHDVLPLRLTAYTPCFRSEAGSAGRDTKGMIRNHQFTKVEMVSITTPETSYDELERMTNVAETILKKLELPYRVMALCSGDIGFGSQKTYDLEVWVPSQNKYREISSCSVCGDFQARRMNTRFKNHEQKNIFVHTLNGSGLAVGRTLVAILENYQNKDGTINVPHALVPYMDGLTLIQPHHLFKK
jgi:seryl-tRNA synthetase